MNSCIITEKIVKNIIEKRRREIHKGDCGRVLIVAGSEGMTGAAVLCARAALRSGAGLTQIALPKELFPIAQAALPEATCITRDFSKTDLSRYDAVALGPGLGDSEESVEGVNYILKFYEGPLVLDADGLNITANHGFLELLRQRRGETIITPHIGEAKRILESEAKRILQAACSAGQGEGDFAGRYSSGDYNQWRIKMAEDLKTAADSTVVLKGAGTVVATLDDKTYINTTGNPGMATAGSGDVLTGLMAGIWAQKNSQGERISAENAALAAVFLHGLSGDLAALRLGEHGLIAGDIAENIPFAIKEILG